MEIALRPESATAIEIVDVLQEIDSLFEGKLCAIRLAQLLILAFTKVY
jgi:hypothetical protein